MDNTWNENEARKAHEERIHKLYPREALISDLFELLDWMATDEDCNLPYFRETIGRTIQFLQREQTPTYADIIRQEATKHEES